MGCTKRLRLLLFVLWTKSCRDMACSHKWEWVILPGALIDAAMAKWHSFCLQGGGVLFSNRWWAQAANTDIPQQQWTPASNGFPWLDNEMVRIKFPTTQCVFARFQAGILTLRHYSWLHHDDIHFFKKKKLKNLKNLKKKKGFLKALLFLWYKLKFTNWQKCGLGTSNIQQLWSKKLFFFQYTARCPPLEISDKRAYNFGNNDWFSIEFEITLKELQKLTDNLGEN